MISDIINPIIIGTIAATLTTICFIPQAIKTVVTKDTDGISFLMYFVFSMGVTFWLFYGLLIDSPPVIIANAITLPLALLILYCKIKNMRK